MSAMERVVKERERECIGAEEEKNWLEGSTGERTGQTRRMSVQYASDERLHF